MRLLKSCSAFIIIISMFTFILLPCSAAEKRKVSVAFPVLDDNMFYVVNEDGSLEGMMYDYFEELSRCTGWEMDYRVGSMDELYPEFLAGDIDLMGTTYYTEDVEQFADYPAFSSGIDYICLSAAEQNNTITPGDYSSLDNKKAAVYKNYKVSGKIAHLEDFITANHINLEIVYYDDFQALLNAVPNGEADLLLSGNVSMPSGYKEIVKFSDKPYYTVVSKGKTDILRELNVALYSMHIATDQFETEINGKYFSKTDSAAPLLTQEEMDWLNEQDFLTAAIVQEDSFLSFKSKNSGEYDNFAKSIATYFAESIGIELKIIYVDTNAEAIDLVKSGKADFTPALYLFSGKYESFPEDIQLFPYYNIEQIKITNPNAKDPSSLAVLSSQKPLYEDEHDNIILGDSLSKCVGLVSSGKAATTYMDMFSAQYYIIQEGYNNLQYEVLNEQVGTMNVGAYADADPRLLTILEKIRICASRDRIFDLILQNVMNQNKDVSLSYFIREHIVGFSIIVVFLLLVIFSCVFGILLSRAKQRAMAETLRIRTDNERALNAALNQANTATKAKSRFLSNMSHEMRTPLNGIAGMLTLMQHDGLSEKNEDYMNKAKIAVNQMVSLINSVLDMSRIESGKEILTESKCSLHQIISEVLLLLRGQAEEKKITLNVDTEKFPARKIVADNLKLKQILLNVGGNAIKFTPEGGTVELTAELLADAPEGCMLCQISCRDTGIGMSRDYIKNIFLPFSRDIEAEQQQIKGTGLGLAITSSIVEMMRGSIDIESTPGEGSTFRIALPLRLAAEETSNDPAEKKEVSNVTAHSELLNSPPDLRGRHLLLAEDNELNLEIAKELLSITGADIISVADGLEAVEAFKSTGPGYYYMIFMDIQMPNMDGYEAAQAIRSLDRVDAACIPIIAMTANAFASDIQQSLEMGMNGHIPKPIDLRELYRILEKYL